MGGIRLSDNLDKFVEDAIKAIDPKAKKKDIEETKKQTRMALNNPEAMAKALEKVQIGHKKTTDDFITEAINIAGKQLRGEEEE